MLILTRKVGEMIRIGDMVTVRVLEVRGSQVRLGVDAPADVRIFREEVYRALQDATPDVPASDAPGTNGTPRPPAANGDRRGKPPAA
jgi:carbon storage regulator